jgi:hypothetical protein
MITKTIEFPSRGATYCRDEYGVYTYDTYPRTSVLAGQERRTFVDRYPTLAEAQAAHPDATVTAGCGYRDINAMVAHLPGDDDPDPFGDFDPNDI